jgi:shikimate kinase
MMDERMPFYEKAYDIRIDVDGKSLEEIAEEIIKGV